MLVKGYRYRVPPGTEIEELEFDAGVPLGYAWHPPRTPPRQHGTDAKAVRRLAGALVERLTRALPAGFSLARDHGRLLLLRDGDVLHRTEMSWAFDGDDETLAGCMWGVLDEVMNTIAEETGDPWPNTRPRLPSAIADVRDGVLHLSYADEDGVVLELEPIQLSELR